MIVSHSHTGHIEERLPSKQTSYAFQDNGVAGENFPCKAYVFSPSKEECHLSAESGTSLYFLLALI